VKAEIRRPIDRGLDDVLYALIENMTVAVSGERLARDLGMSHSRIVRLIEKLRSQGLEILGEPFAGFRLTRLPDVLIPQTILERLHNGRIGRTFHHLYEVESTNGYAMELLNAAAVDHGTVVVAESQSAGRGRRGRTWLSARGLGLYLTMVLKPNIPCNLAPLLTLGAAVAAHDSIERISGLEVDIKWPNDLLVGRRKIGGVLSELEAELDHVRSLVVGLGINVNHEKMPEEIREIASSLRIESGRAISRTEILLDLLATFDRLYEAFVLKGPKVIIEPWTRSSSFASDRTLEVDDGVRRIRGTTEGLNALGALRIRQANGSIEEVYSGDVIRWE